MNVLQFEEKPPHETLHTMSMDTSCYGGCTRHARHARHAHAHCGHAPPMVWCAPPRGASTVLPSVRSQACAPPTRRSGPLSPAWASTFSKSRRDSWQGPAGADGALEAAGAPGAWAARSLGPAHAHPLPSSLLLAARAPQPPPPPPLCGQVLLDLLGEEFPAAVDFSRDILPAVIGERSIVAYRHTSVRGVLCRGGRGLRGAAGASCHVKRKHVLPSCAQTACSGPLPSCLHACSR